MTKDYEITKRYQQKQIAKGLCVNGCGRPLKTSRHCKECAEKSSFNANKKRSKRRLELITQGLCSEGCGRPLVLKWTCRECADKIQQYARNWRLRNPEKNKRLKRESVRKHKYSGLYDLVMDRDHKSCQVCGHSDHIVIHHINEIPKDNRMENLIVLCRICHAVIERMNRTRPNLHLLFPWL